MAISETDKRKLCLFGREALAKIAAFHTREVKAIENKEQANEADVEKQKFISRLCSASPSFINGFKRAFSPMSVKLIFNKDNVELVSRQFHLKFTESELLAFFLAMVRPYIREIYFIETHFWRIHLIEISRALIGDEEYSCIDSDTMLKFDRTGNDNAYGTLIEFLGPKIKGISIDDEFVAQLRDEEFKFNSLTITAQHKAEMYYTKSYFDIHSKEYVLLNVCTLTNMIMFSDFGIKSQEHIEKITMSLGENESHDVIVEGSEYLRFLAPNLKRLTLVQSKGFVFSDPEKSSQAGHQIRRFFEDKYQNLISDVFPHVDIDLRLELSLYVKEDALKSKIDWVSVIIQDYPELKEVATEFDTKAYQVVIPGNKNGDSVIIRIHSYDRDFNESDKNHFSHPTPPSQIL